MIKRATNDNAGAIQDLNQAMALNASSAVYFNVRASIKQELADDKGAIADSSQSLEIKPDEWAGLTSRVELHDNSLGWEERFAEFTGFAPATASLVILEQRACPSFY